MHHTHGQISCMMFSRIQEDNDSSEDIDFVQTLSGEAVVVTTSGLVITSSDDLVFTPLSVTFQPTDFRSYLRSVQLALLNSAPWKYLIGGMVLSF